MAMTCGEVISASCTAFFRPPPLTDGWVLDFVSVIFKPQRRSYGALDPPSDVFSRPSESFREEADCGDWSGKSAILLGNAGIVSKF